MLFNRAFIKFRDDLGPVNLLGTLAPPFHPSQLTQHTESQVPPSLVIRSLPVNVEWIELIRENRRQENKDQSMIDHLGKFIHIDQLNQEDAKYYMQELHRICGEDIDNNFSMSNSSSDEGERAEEEARVADYDSSAHIK